MKIKLSNSDLYTEIDDEDFKLIEGYSCVFHQGYVNVRKKRLHRIIMGVSDSNIFIDHVDRNKLNNKKSNLRICNQFENSKNRNMSLSNTTGYKGVYPKDTYFGSSIGFDYKIVFLGYFDDVISAAVAYDIASLELYGEFSSTNLSLGLYSEEEFNVVKKKLELDKKKSKVQRNCKNKYKGIRQIKNGRWKCAICNNYTLIFIGYFSTEEEAARAYDAKAKELFGEKARLNFPDEVL